VCPVMVGVWLDFDTSIIQPWPGTGKPRFWREGAAATGNLADSATLHRPNCRFAGDSDFYRRNVARACGSASHTSLIWTWSRMIEPLRSAVGSSTQTGFESNPATGPLLTLNWGEIRRRGEAWVGERGAATGTARRPRQPVAPKVVGSRRRIVSPATRRSCRVGRSRPE
jgi:hypothetical protein